MEIISKVFKLILFVMVSLVFVPMLVIVHFFTEPYEKWFGDITKM